FARSVGEFESLDALRVRIRTDLEEEAAAHADSVATVRLLDAVLEANPFEVPRSMVERYLDSVIGDTSGAAPHEAQQAREPTSTACTPPRRKWTRASPRWPNGTASPPRRCAPSWRRRSGWRASSGS